MVRDCSSSGGRIAALTVSRQSEGSLRRDIARDPCAATRHQLYRSGHIIRLSSDGFGKSHARVFDDNEEGAAGCHERRPKAAARLPHCHHRPRRPVVKHGQRNPLQRIRAHQFGWSQCPSSDFRGRRIAPSGESKRAVAPNRHRQERCARRSPARTQGQPAPITINPFKC
jgi:hypothetical protein